MIKAVLFDFDGVLVDATEVHYESFNKALSFFGLEEISRTEHDTIYNGIPTKEKLKIRKIPESYHSEIQKKKQQFTIEEISKISPILEVCNVLKYLKSRSFLIACCSNSIRDTIICGLEKTLLINYFDLIISNEDVCFSKPDPEMYLKAMSAFKLQPEECLIIEDSDKGLAAALFSNASVLKINNPYDLSVDLIEKALL